MSIGAYLPSSQFGLIVTSLLLSVGLVYAADYVTTPHAPGSLASADIVTPASDWQQSLEQIQKESSFATLPDSVDEATISDFLVDAESSNLTSTLARSLFINLSNAKSQGLGSDIPTQDKLIAEAAAKASAKAAAAAYTHEDLRIVVQTAAATKEYGNKAMAILQAYPAASFNDTYVALAYAADYQDRAQLKKLRGIQDAYDAIAQDLAGVTVPQTLAPLHLKVVNNLTATALSYDEMVQLLDDPIRALGGIAQFSLLQDEAARVFTNVAVELQKSGILFTKDEPGSAWSVFLSP